MKLRSDTPPKIILAQFKASHGFSHSHIADMFGCTVDDSRQWSEHGATDQINQLCLSCDKAIERWRQASGAFSHIDRQLYESQIGSLQRTIQYKEGMHNQYVIDCEKEPVLTIIKNRIKKRLVWFRVTTPFANILTRGK